MAESKIDKEVNYRFVVTTADGPKNFLTVIEDPEGDIHIAIRGRKSRGDWLSSKNAAGADDKENRVSEIITIHPSPNAEDKRITVNYKTISNGKEVERIRMVALEVKNGLTFFPVLGSIGENIGAPSFDFARTKKAKDVRVLLWPNQQFDWTLHSLGYAFFVCNTELNHYIPADFPYVVQILRFRYFQLLFVYWSVDKPTRGAALIQKPLANDQPALGIDAAGVVDFLQSMRNMHEKHYVELPDFIQGQLPDHPVYHHGIEIVDPRIYLKRPSFRIQTHRDASMLRLHFRDAHGAEIVIDLNGSAIAEFRDVVDQSIRTNPGLVEWGANLPPFDFLSARQRPSDPDPNAPPITSDANDSPPST